MRAIILLATALMSFGLTAQAGEIDKNMANLEGNGNETWTAVLRIDEVTGETAIMNTKDVAKSNEATEQLVAHSEFVSMPKKEIYTELELETGKSSWFWFGGGYSFYGYRGYGRYYGGYGYGWGRGWGYGYGYRSYYYRPYYGYSWGRYSYNCYRGW